MEPLVLSAADGYGKIADKPAFVNVHLAAGTRQGSGQLQNAFFDGTPMVVTAAMRDTGSFADHVTLGSSGGFSQMGVVEDITKRRWEVWDARGVPTVTRRAFQEAMTLPTAPVYVAYTSQALDTPGVEATIQPGAAPVMGRLPEEGVLRTIFDALLNAENPLLVCGIDIRYAHAEREIVELAERLALPVATGIFDYGSFPVHHPNYIGSVETLSEEPYDVVCCVGYRQSGRGGPVDLRFQQAGMVIGMGHDHTKLGNTFALDVGVWATSNPCCKHSIASGSRTMPASRTSSAALAAYVSKANGGRGRTRKRCTIWPPRRPFIPTIWPTSPARSCPTIRWSSPKISAPPITSCPLALTRASGV